MSYTTLSPPQAEIAAPGVTILKNSNQVDIEKNSYPTNPANIIINIKDSKPSNKEDGEDRQRQDEPEKRKNSKTKPRTGLAYWARRILIGKDEYEEKQEEKNHKHLNLIKKECRRHIAEFIGSFFIVLFIAGIQVNQNFNSKGGVSNVDKGLVAGFLLAGLIFCFGNVSGAHFNPVVTLAFALRGSFTFFRTISYIITQFAGAVVGAAVLYSIFGSINGLGTTVPAKGLEAKDALGIEIMITFILITVILTTAENAQILGATSGLAVGMTFGSLELWAWDFSGASANPWRTIGPTMISGFGWETYWVYIVGPLVGMLLAVFVQRMLVTGIKRQDTEDAGAGEGKNGEPEDN